MKQIFKTIFAVLLTVVAVNSSFARADSEKRNREELVINQAKHIAGKLNLDEATTAKFVETYTACQKEIWSQCPPPGQDVKITTDAEAEAAIMQQFEHGQKMLDIRRKYYEEYKKFLTPLQIEKVYRFEGKMMGRLAKKHHTAEKRREARKKHKEVQKKRREARERRAANTEAVS